MNKMKEKRNAEVKAMEDEVHIAIWLNILKVSLSKS
jgi:hypothetical protein